MSIYLWITAIAAITFLIAAVLLFRKFLAGKDNGLAVFSVIVSGVFISGVLYILASINGTQILSSDFATEYQLKEETFKTTDTDTADYQSAAYAFYAESGVKYQIHGSELLHEPDAAPAFVGIYSCEAVDGYPWCYLKKGKVVRYTLTALSHDGKEAADYGVSSNDGQSGQ